MRQTIRPGIDAERFLVTISLSEPSKPSGTLFFPTSRNDLKLWFDQHSFPHELKQTSSLKFWVKHKKCDTSYSISVRYSTDPPKHTLICGLCFKKWEKHQLDKMLPKDFAETFEYAFCPTAPWPYTIKTVSNGVTKHGKTIFATEKEAAEYYFREFTVFKNNGFMWSKQ